MEEVISKPVAKLSFKEAKELEQIEAELAKLESDKQLIENQLSNGEIADHTKLYDLGLNLVKVEKLLDDKTMRWLELSEKVG